MESCKTSITVERVQVLGNLKCSKMNEIYENANIYPKRFCPEGQVIAKVAMFLWNREMDFSKAAGFFPLLN